MAAARGSYDRFPDASGEAYGTSKGSCDTWRTQSPGSPAYPPGPNSGYRDVYEILLTQTTQIVCIPDTFDPGRKKEVVQMLRWLMLEALGRERAVSETLENYLPRLREIAGKEG